MTGERLAELGWRFLCEQSMVVLLRVDRQGTIRYANRHARRLTGLPLQGGSLTEMIVSFDGEPDLEQWLRPSEEPVLMNVRTAGDLPQTLSVSVVPAGEELVFFGQVDAEEMERLRREVLVLNHEHAELSRELGRKNAELAQLNALKNQFLGMAAHDLRKPVGLVLSYAEILTEDAAGSMTPDQLRLLETIRTSADRMGRLIDDFLDVSVIEAGRLSLDIQAVELEELIRAARRLVGMAAGRRRIRIETELDPAVRRLRVDGPKIEQVLTNLLSNAVEHSPADGAVIIGSHQEAGGVRLCIADKGEGIPVEQQRRLFQAFASGGEGKPGGERSIGLGLAIARKIVEAHGGRVFVESAPGQGSVFGFALPESCVVATAVNASAESRI